MLLSLSLRLSVKWSRALPQMVLTTNTDLPDTEVGSPQPPSRRNEDNERVPALFQGGRFKFLFFAVSFRPEETRQGPF